MRLRDRKARKIKFWIAQDRKYLRQIKDRNYFFDLDGVIITHDPVDESDDDFEWKITETSK